MGGAANSGKRNILTNAAVNWLGYAVDLGIAFFMSPVLVHALGDQQYGIWALVDSVLAYLTVLDLGVAASVVRYVARFEAAADQDKVNRVFSTSLCIFAVAGALALAVATGLALFAFPHFPIPQALLPRAQGMLVLLGINFGVGLPLGVFSCVLSALGRFPAINGIRVISLLVRTGLFLVIVHEGGGLLAIGFAITLCNLLEQGGYAFAARHYLPRIRFALGFVDRETFRTIKNYTVDAFVALIAGRISFQTDALVIGWFLAPEQITLFMIGARLVNYSKDCLRVMTTVLTPAVSALEARGDEARIRRLFLDGTRYVLWLILPIQAGLMTLGKPFLELWMGPRYALLSYPTLVILSIPLTLAMAQSIGWRVLFATSRIRWLARALLMEALANLILSLALVKPLGIEGVAWGTTIPNIFMFVALVAYMGRILRVSLVDYGRQAILKPLGPALLLAVFWLIAAPTETPTWPALVGVGVIGLSGYALVAGVVEFGVRGLIRGADWLRQCLTPAPRTGAAPREPDPEDVVCDNVP
jgi:O-antigen/teichoic acid export membrane protein